MTKLLKRIILLHIFKSTKELSQNNGKYRKWRGKFITTYITNEKVWRRGGGGGVKNENRMPDLTWDDKRGKRFLVTK